MIGMRSRLPDLDPRWRVAYLLAVAVGVFLVPALWMSAAALAVQAVLWLAVGLGARELPRQLGKLWGFALLVLVSYALSSTEDGRDRWIQLELAGRQLSINQGGVQVGAQMVLRVATVVLASQIARAGDSRAIARGLGALGVPALASLSLDAVLALLGTASRRGAGDGSGGGKHEQRPGGTGFLASVRGLAKVDARVIFGGLDRQIARAEAHLEAHQGGQHHDRIRDVAVIAGVALVMLGIKAVKVLPSLPFAPGHKLVVVTPFYVIARQRTATRAGSTATGLVMGTAAFLLGDGRYGVFEVLKHVVPGVLCDLAVPRMTAGGRPPGVVSCIGLGAAIGAGRFAAIFAVTLAAQPPAVAYAFLVPGILVHVGFGALSGVLLKRLLGGTGAP